jgi:hypothetical protein
LDGYAHVDGLRSWLVVDAADTLEQLVVLGLDAVSVDSQIGLVVGLYHPVGQPVAFVASDGGWKHARLAVVV